MCSPEILTSNSNMTQFHLKKYIKMIVYKKWEDLEDLKVNVAIISKFLHPTSGEESIFHVSLGDQPILKVMD